MSKLSREDVLKLAHLSRLKLTDQEVDTFSVQLTEILNYVEKLNKVDTSDLQPMYQVTGLSNVNRKDQVRDYKLSREELLSNAPATQEGQFKVRKVL